MKHKLIWVNGHCFQYGKRESLCKAWKRCLSLGDQRTTFPPAGACEECLEAWKEAGS